MRNYAVRITIFSVIGDDSRHCALLPGQSIPSFMFLMSSDVWVCGVLCVSYATMTIKEALTQAMHSFVSSHKFVPLCCLVFLLVLCWTLVVL